VRPCGEVFDKLKEAQAELRDSYLPKGVHDDLRQKIQDLWDAVKEYIGEQEREYEERQRERAERQAEFERRNREWRERQGCHIARWTERVENQYAYIESLEGQIEGLQDKLDSALRWPRNVRQDLGNLRENPAWLVNRRLEAQGA
jgi:predicted RNase H-like nuclease (RuvC/YqgF family)